MLNRFSLTFKLVAMVVIPVAALVLFAIMDLNRRMSVSAEMANLEGLTRLAMAANQVAGALHEERSLTAGSLTATGSSTRELEVAYGQTDRLIESFQNQYAVTDTGALDEELSSRIQEAFQGLRDLGDVRRQIAAGELSTAEAVSLYNNLTQKLLVTVTLVSRMSTNVEVKTMLTALDVLTRIKEAADLERAALNVAFTADHINPDLLQAVMQMIARQETLETMFLSHAPEEGGALYRQSVQGSALEEVETTRLEAINGVGLKSLGVNPRHWWQVSSARIEAMAEVERQLAAATLSRVDSLRSGTRRAMLVGIVSVILAVGGAIALSALVGRGINRSLSEVTDTIRSVVEQISTSVQQLTASTGETAAAVSQTSTTVEELRQTSEGAAAKAQATSDAAIQSRGASDDARRASESGIDAMQTIRRDVEGIAERIVELSEKSAQISDIVQNVNAIAEQSNLLAVNASIEAAKAGEQGRGFAVVAGEVRTLAERSKDATEQIRAILGDIQRSSNAAVMVTEQGVKRVDDGNNVIAELGQGIRSLAETVQESSDAAQQISLISSQQLAGIEQITEALRSVEQAASENAAGAEQLEGAAHRLKTVSDQITFIVEGTGAVAHAS